MNYAGENASAKGTATDPVTGKPHVDHLHPDSGIALATAADGERLTRECFGDRVAWVPWRRPGFQLGLDIAAMRRDHPGAIGVAYAGSPVDHGVAHPRRRRCGGRVPALRYLHTGAM
jgi:rhamnose utilization protein RhaD (predicted bifunctional aldolase and dehydrogenase)